MHVYVLELAPVRGPSGQKRFVHLGRSYPPMDEVLREIDDRIEESERGHRALVPLHRRRTNLSYEVRVNEIELADEIVLRAVKCLSEHGKPLNLPLPNVFDIDREEAVCCLKNAHSRAKAAISRRASAKAAKIRKQQLPSELGKLLVGMHKGDDLPPLVCDVLDGLFGEDILKRCEMLLSELPAADDDNNVYCPNCDGAAEVHFSVEKGWHHVSPKGEESGMIWCERCSDFFDPGEPCAECGRGHPLNDLDVDFDGKRVCPNCFDNEKRQRKRNRAEEKELEWIREQIHGPKF